MRDLLFLISGLFGIVDLECVLEYCMALHLFLRIVQTCQTRLKRRSTCQWTKSWPVFLIPISWLATELDMR